MKKLIQSNSKFSNIIFRLHEIYIFCYIFVLELNSISILTVNP